MKTPLEFGAAIVVEEPPGAGPGHWAGAPGAFSDGVSIYLVYRLRWPRPRRGGELHGARGEGERFETIWRATREDFGSLQLSGARSSAMGGRGGSTSATWTASTGAGAST